MSASLTKKQIASAPLYVYESRKHWHIHQFPEGFVFVVRMPDMKVYAVAVANDVRDIHQFASKAFDRRYKQIEAQDALWVL